MLLGIWRAADHPWSARLVEALPLWMPRARLKLHVSPSTEAVLLSISARSIDRILRRHRVALRKRLYGTTKPGTLLKHQIPIRSERWDESEPGWCEVDTVSHCGESGEGQFVFSVNLTDIATGWTETRAILGKGQRHVVAALEDIRVSLPFPLRGIDSDSGSEFINSHCYDWCEAEGLVFTRSRPYHKNDNAHVEQKNWTHVRRIFGWKRFDTIEDVEIMNTLYTMHISPLLNQFLPSVKLIERVRVGSRVRRRYDRAQTPLDRLLASGIDSGHAKALHSKRTTVDPFALAEHIDKEVEQLMRTPNRPSPKARLGLGLTAPLSPKSAEQERKRRSATVRSYVAR